jgi:hypothetical protein
MAITDKSERQLQDMVAEMGGDPARETEFLAQMADPGAGTDLIEVDLESGPVDPEVEIVDTPDGGAVVTLDGADSGLGGLLPSDHEANLANYLDEGTLREMAMDLIADVEEDLRSRREWERTLKEALKQLGLKMEDKNKPWQGACSVVHPLVAESVVRFQSSTIGDILPPSGPVRCSVVGRQTPEKIQKAHRVSNHMNYTLMNEMREYRPETERLLFGLSLNGSAFRKIFKNPLNGKPKSIYIDADDLIVHNEATDIRDADRITHRMNLSPVVVRQYQWSGFYRDIDLQSPYSSDSEYEEAVQELTGVRPATGQQEKREIYEIQCYRDLGEGDGYDLPYIVTVDVSAQTVLAIYRNWDPDAAFRERIQHIVHYEFIPGLGFYGFGYAHLIGNTAKGVTSILQQLVDAGTLANVPGGLKTRTARMVNDSGPVLPGEWRDVDVPSSKLGDHFMPLPTKEPSGTLYQLMQGLVEDGRRLASSSDLKLSDMQKEAPVGTTLAILERSLKMQTAIQQRIHAGLKEEFQILARIIGSNDPTYPYEVEEGEEIAAEDYSDEIDIIPVSDPNAATLSQRVMQYQAALTAAQQTPQVYDLSYLNRQFVEAIGMQNADKLVPTEDDIDGMDPITENAEIMNLGKVAAKQYQDHESHIRVHMAMKQDPSIQQMTQNSPMGGQIMSALDAHIREHVAFQMRQEMEEAIGAPLPELGKKMPEDIENRIARLAADAGDQIIGRKQAMAQAQENAQKQQDPIIQMKMQELQIRQKEVEAKIQQQQMDAQQKAQKAMLDQMMEQAKFRADMDLEQRRLALDRQEMILDAMTKLAQMEESQAVEGARLGVEIARSVEESRSGQAE